MKLKIEELTAEAFAPFGRVVEQPPRAADVVRPGWSWWGEDHQLAGDLTRPDRPYAVGYLDLRPAQLSFDWAERHMHSDEMVIPTGGDCLVYVAPADHPAEPSRLPPLEQFRVFRLQP